MNCGLIGRKLGHSYSPQIHAMLGDYPYKLYELEPEDIGNFLTTNRFTGLNVTIPYKKDVIPYCSDLTPAAKKLGSVNTILRQANGSLIGHNTDYFGFLSTIRKTGLSVSGKKSLVLGSGGASVTAVAVLRELGSEVVVISRSGKNNYSNLHTHSNAALIVNATPVGMYPNNGISPVSLDIFPALEGVIDMIYNPSTTALLQQAKERNLIAENGLWMLVAQAKESAEWFTDKAIDDSIIPTIYNKLYHQMQNIILVGMPGCGKSTVGKILSEMTGRQFIDSDSYIAQSAGMPIPDILATNGEEHFRLLETDCLSQLGKKSGAIIATGGGCVTRSRNYPLLHQNGTIVWLQRNIADLPTDGRPLSKSGSLIDMYRIRRPLYELFSDLTVSNDRDPMTTAKEILNRLQMEV